MLEVKDISKSFRGVHALDKVCASFYDGEIHGLVGENGAGKSTLMKIVSGVYPPDSGVIRLDQTPVGFDSPIDAYNAGIRIVHQELSLIRSLSIAENMFIHKFRNAGPFSKVARRKLEADAQQTLQEWNIDLDASYKVQDVSMGVRQLVEIARELSTGGRIVILDEPTSSLTYKEIDQLFGVMKHLRQKGHALIFISHRLNEVTDIVDRITVLRDGEVMVTAEKKDLTPVQMVNMIAGREVKDLFPKTEVEIGKTALEARELSGKGFERLSFDVKWGEIVGVAGLVGAGRSELVRCLYGANPRYTGEIRLEGKKVDIDTPETAIRHKVGFLSESRGIDGIFPDMSVAMNLVILKIADVIRKVFLNKSRIREKYTRLVSDLKIVCHDPERQKISELSGGNQQKALFGRLLGSRPRILILDEPTRGVDIANKTEIHKVMGKFVKDGGAIVMVSSELDELIGVSDRILVLHEGRHVGSFARGELNKEKILLCMMDVKPQC
jgi:ABC-type sugar transport system ATPase subunit